MKRQKNNIFIPFLEGALHYNCEECNSACCRNPGPIIMSTKEKNRFFQKHPFLKFFFLRKTAKRYAMNRYSECWFLDKGGGCSIHKKYGYALKPFLCRLHPFYVMKCGKGYMVVTGRCPNLYVDKENKGSSYSQLLKNAGETIELEYFFGEIRDWPKSKLKLEKDVFAALTHFLDNSDYIDFAVHQITLAEDTNNTAKTKEELKRWLTLWKSFFGIEGMSLKNKKITYELTALTSLLRIKSPVLRKMDNAKIPLALLALYFYMILFAEVSRSDETKPNYLMAYEGVLGDFAVDLLNLKKEDLALKDRSLEEKMGYLRFLARAQKRLFDKEKQKIKQRLRALGYVE